MKGAKGNVGLSARDDKSDLDLGCDFSSFSQLDLSCCQRLPGFLRHTINYVLSVWVSVCVLGNSMGENAENLSSSRNESQ